MNRRLKRLSLTMMVSIALLFQGCIVKSLYPFFTDETLVFKPEFLNDWVDVDGNAWEVQEGKGKNSYRMYYTVEGRTMDFVVHLFSLDGEYYVDFYLNNIEAAESELFRMHVVRTHSIARVEKLTMDEIRIKWFNEKWLHTLFEQKRIRIGHETVFSPEGIGEYILTAPTTELQKFVVKYSHEDSHYDDENTVRLVLKRPGKSDL